MKIEYLAGFFDGEGCVTLTLHGNTVCLRVNVVNTNYELLSAIQENFGGNLKPMGKAHEGHKQAYVIRWHDREGERILELLAPHVIAKKEQVELALQFCVHKRSAMRKEGRFLTDSARYQDQWFKEEMHDLNRKGRPKLVDM